MKQNVNPTIVGIAIAVILIIVGVIGYMNFFHSSSSPAPGVSSSTISQQYQKHVMQERPPSGSAPGKP